MASKRRSGIGEIGMVEASAMVLVNLAGDSLEGGDDGRDAGGSMRPDIMQCLFVFSVVFSCVIDI